MIFLQILGAIVLAIIIVIVAIYLFFRIKFGKYLGQDFNEPFEIHLSEDISPDWLKDKSAKKFKEELIALEFMPVMAYTVDEMEPVSLLHLQKQQVNAVLYKHNIAGTWVDFYVVAEDGREFTVNNVPLGENIESRPNCIKYTGKNETISQLYKRIEKIVAQIDPKTFTPDEFRQLFEDVYKKDMAWRTHRGGTTYNEFVKEARASEEFKNMSEKKLKEGFSLHKLEELNNWHYSAIRHYEGKANVDIYEEDYHYIIVPENAYIPALLKYFEEEGFINEKQLEKLEKALSGKENLAAYSVFEKINSLFSPERRAELVTTQDFPLNLRLYRHNRI